MLYNYWSILVRHYERQIYQDRDWGTEELHVAAAFHITPRTNQCQKKVFIFSRSLHPSFLSLPPCFPQCIFLSSVLFLMKLKHSPCGLTQISQFFIQKRSALLVKSCWSHFSFAFLISAVTNTAALFRKLFWKCYHKLPITLHAWWSFCLSKNETVPKETWLNAFVVFLPPHLMVALNEATSKST